MSNPNASEKTGAALAPLSESPCSALVWHRGPANGGGGTSESRNGQHYWWDGDQLLIVVGLSDGDRDVALVNISADDGGVELQDTLSGDYIYDWSTDDIYWWAKVEDAHLPPLPNSLFDKP